MANKSKENTGKKEKPRQPWNKITMTGEELLQKVNEYLQQCDEQGKRATKPGLSVFCGFSVDTYDNWIKNKDGRHTKHASVLKMAELVMSDRLQQEDKTIALFLLKQPCYGGYADKQEANEGNHKITIDILSNGTKIT